MSNVLEYTLSLQDKISSKLQKIGIHNDEMLDKFSEVQKKAVAVSKSFSNMGTSINTLTQKIELLKAERDLLPIGSLSAIRKYNSEINKLEGKVSKLQTLNGSKIKTWFTDAFNSLPGLATNPLVAVGAGVGLAVKKGMESDMMRTNLETLFRGNKDAAAAMYKSISTYAIKSPYEKSDLIEGQKIMMQFGVSANDSFGVLKNIGDIAMGDAQKMKSLSLAFGQVSSAGKLQGQDLLQMINAGFNPLQVISERTGQSMSSLKDKMSKGAITAEMVGNAFKMATDKQGLFYKGAEKAGETLGGKWSTMVDAFSEMLLSVYNAISPILFPLVETATLVLETIGGGIGWIIDKLKGGDAVVTAMAYAIGAFALALLAYNTYAGIAAIVTEKLTWAVVKSNLAFLASPVGIVAAVIGVLIGVIVYCWQKFEGFRIAVFSAWEMLKTFGVTIKEYVINRLKELLSGITGIGAALIAFFSGDWKKAWEIGKRAGTDLLGINSAKTALSGLKNQLPKDLVIGTKLGKTMGKVNAIAPPSLPGASTSGMGSGTAKGPSTKTNEAIATGGTKNTVVNIVIKELNGLKDVVISSKDAANKAGESVADELLRILAMAGSATG